MYGVGPKVSHISKGDPVTNPVRSIGLQSTQSQLKVARLVEARPQNSGMLDVASEPWPIPVRQTECQFRIDSLAIAGSGAVVRRCYPDRIQRSVYELI